MPEINDPTAVRFCNEKVRPMADALETAYRSAAAIVDEWNATGMADLVTNTQDEIIDGAQQDGRNVITGAQATAIITRAMEFIADYEAGGNAKLNTVLQVSVNGEPKF
jgi:hypothetical protein